MKARQSATFACVLALAGTAVLGGCADSMPRLSDLNPFKEKQIPLPGKRVPVTLSETKTGSIELASADRPVALPAPRQNEGWEQPGGSAANAPGHLQFSASPRVVWSGDAGQGSSKLGRLTSSPIVAYGKVFTLDTAGRVTAFSTSGSIAWRASMVPEGAVAHKAYGGGLAADGGRLYVATGHGVVVALDPQSGKRLWEKNVNAPVRAAPTAANGRVFLVATDGRVFALSGNDGREEWAYRGLPQATSLLIGASPAVDGDVVIVPFPNGELVALKASDGTSVWTESLARTRTASSLGAMSDAARPAVDNGIVFAIGHAGRMVATSTRTGERVWSLNVPGIQMPYVAGDMIYVVDTTGQLMALGRRDGKAVWTTKLSGAKSWSGPVLGGGRLWLASDAGQLVGVNAVTGKVELQQSLGGKIFIAPVIAGGRMFVMNDSARLISLN